jgi:hypothetical protein
VGDFHLSFIIDPGSPAEVREAEELNRKLVEQAIARPVSRPPC